MSSDSDESLDASYHADSERSAGARGSFRRPDGRQAWRSPPSDESDKLDDLLRPTAVHPLVDRDNNSELLRADPSSSPLRQPSNAASSLSLSSLSSSMEIAVVKSTLPPQIPALHRLNHLKNHMKQLKRLYRQEVQQEELAKRDALLQMLCTSSITMFRHCPSRARFFTAVRALLCQYLPALDSKLLEVEHFDGRSYLVAQAKDEVSARDQDTDPIFVELSEQNAVDHWERIGIAGRAASLTGTTIIRDDASRPSSSARQLDLGCIERWGRSVADYVVPCPNQHLVFQFPAAELLQIGFHPEIDLAIPLSNAKKAQDNTDLSPDRFESRYRGHTRQNQGLVELRLLVVVLQDAQGGAVAVFEAVMDASTRLSIEFLDAFGVLLASAIEMRRKVCRSTMGEVDIQIRRQSTINDPMLQLPVLSIPVSSTTDGLLTNSEIIAFNSGAVLEETDSALLRAFRKPVESLLVDSEARAREIAFHKLVVTSVRRMWDRLHDQLYTSDVHGWRQYLRSALGDMLTNSDNCRSFEDIQRFKHIHVLFPGENADDYRGVYAIGDALHIEGPTTLSREFEILKQVVESRQSMESTESCAHLTAVPVDVRFRVAPGDSTCSVMGVLVVLEDVDGDDGGLLRKVDQYLFPAMHVVVQAFMELAENHISAFHLGTDLSAARSSSEQYERALAMSKAIAGVMERWTTCGSIEELIDLVGAVNASDISDSLVAMKLLVVDTVGNSAGSSNHPCERHCVWTTVNGHRVMIGTSTSQSITTKELVRLIISRHDVKHDTLSVAQNSETQWAESREERYHVIPLHSHTGSALVLGALELEMSETARHSEVLSTVDPLLRLLQHILNAHIKAQRTRSSWDEQMKSLSNAHQKQWNSMMECANQWSQLPLSDCSWREQISALCRQLVPSADFVNVFLNFADNEDVRENSVATKLMVKDCERVMDGDTRNELCLHNQCVLGAIAHCSLNNGDELLGVLVASKKSDVPFSNQEYQLLHFFAQLVSVQAITRCTREEARLQMASLNDKFVQQSRATQQLVEAHANISVRAQQLLMLLEVTKLGQEFQDHGPVHHDTILLCLQSVVQQVQSALKSVGSWEVVAAVVIDRSDLSKLTCSVIKGVDAASGFTESVVCAPLVRDEDDSCCWYSIRRWVRHNPPFLALPPHILQLMGLSFETKEPSHLPSLLTVLPIDLNGADEDKGSVVFLAITSFEVGGLMDDSFIGELAESVANLLCSRLQVSRLNESARHLSANIATLDSEMFGLQQDSRLLELTHIVWMEVVGSGSPDLTSAAGSNLNDFGEPETERPILRCLRKSLHNRIVPFLSEELRICAVELVFDFEEPARDQLSKRNSITCFMNSIDPSRAQSFRSSADCVTLGTDSTSAVNPTSRFWLVHRFLPREAEDRRCFGLFYIEWELLSPSSTDTAAEKAKRTLVWLSDWLQTLAQYCFDRCSALDQICSRQHEIRDLALRSQSQIECIKVHAHWNDRWTSLLEFSRGLHTELCEASAATAVNDGSSDWELEFAQLSSLSDTAIWSRGRYAQEDMAWTIRPDGTRQCEKWSEVLSWLASDPERFQLIVATSSPSESLGVLELVKYGNHLWSSEHAKKYRELVSFIVGSYVTTMRMSRSNEHSRCIIQTTCESLEAEIHQLRQDTAHSWSVYQQMEKWIQQLYSRQGTRLATNDISVLQELFGRIERQLVDASRNGKKDIVHARILRKIDGDQGLEIITSCDRGCTCRTAPSLVGMLKQIDENESRTELITVTHVDNFPKIFLACEAVQPMDTSGSKTHCVILRARSEDNRNCALIMCVQMKTSDQKSVNMLLLEVLSLRLGDAVTQFLQASREGKQFNLTEQRLAAINCELDTEKRRSTRIIAAMATATRCILDALSAPVDASGPTIIGAVEAVAQCFVDGATIVKLIHTNVKCKSAGSMSDSSTAFAISDNSVAGGVGNRHHLANAEDEIVECVRSTEAEISRIELEVQGARILLTAPGPSEKTHISQLWQDKSALQLIVKLSNALVTIKQAKDEAVTHRNECDIAITALRANCEALEVTCLEAKSALERSEMQRSLTRATVKNMFEPIPTQAVELITRLSSKACASREAVIEALGDALMEMHAVESVVIRESSPGAARTLFTSPIHLLGEKQSILDSDQIRRIVDRCVARQETEILSLKTGKRDTFNTEDSERARRTWLVVMPCIFNATPIVVLLIIPSGQPDRSALRKDLHQVNHAKLLIRLAVWRCEQIFSSAALTARLEHLMKGQQEMDDALKHTNLQLGRAYEEQECHQRMMRGVAHDVFQGLSWSDKTWQRVFPSTRKLVTLWQHLSNVLRDRIATGFAAARSVRVHMFGVIRSQDLVLHLPTASTEFAYSTMMVLAANPSTRRLWDTLTNPVSPEHGLATEEANGSATLVVPVCIQNDSGQNGLPTGAVVVTIVQQRESGTHVLSDGQKRAVGDLVGELAPFVRGILRAVRVKGTGVTSKDQHRDYRLGTQQSPFEGAIAVDMGCVTTPLISSRSPSVIDRCALNRPGEEFGHARDVCNQLESINVLMSNNASRQDMYSIEEAGDNNYDEEDGASTTTSLDSSQGTPRKARAEDERLVRFLLKMQRANDVKALQRLVVDELKGVWAGRSSRSAPNINFELVILSKDSKEDDQGQAIDSVHSALLPEAELTEVLRRIKSLGSSQQPLTPKLWKFSPDNEGKRATTDEFWVAVFTQKAASSALQVSTGLLVVRGVRLQSEFSRHATEISLPQALQGLQQQLVQIRRDTELQAQISDLQRQKVDNNEQTATLAQMETQHLHLNAFSKLALRLSVAESESELVRATSRYLRDLLECHHVVYEPSKRYLSMSTATNMQENQEPVRDESVMVELDQSLCYENDYGESNKNRVDGIQQVTKLATSSRAVEMHHSIKLRVFSALSNDTSSRLLGTFTAHLEAGSAQLSDVERQNTLKSVAHLVNASFHRLQALGLAQKHGRDGKFAVQEHERYRKENSQLLQSQEQYQLSVSTLQQQVGDLARVNSDMKAELADLRARLQQSEACWIQSEQDAELAQQQLVKVAAAADDAQVAREGVSQLQEVVEAQQERVRVLEKRNMKRRLQAQQLADEVGRLKKTEEIDKFRIAELEKQLAVAQQQQQLVRNVDHSGVGIGTGGHTSKPDASNTSRRRVRTSERHVSRQQERATTIQKLKQMRLAEELRCLAALEVRELHTRQGELGQVRRAASIRGHHTRDSNLKRVQHGDQLPLQPPV